MLRGPIEWYLSERANLIVRVAKETKDCVGNEQPPVKLEGAPCAAGFASVRGARERRLRRCAVQHGLLYAHPRTAVWKIINTPTEDSALQYDQRGWCLLEKALADLISLPHFSLDISKFENRESDVMFKVQRCTASSAFGTAAGARKSIEELAAQADQKESFGKEQPFPTLD
eukprot:820836-Rhodomonas_salina.1